MTRKCDGPDRSGCCRRCGASDHKGASSEASNEAARAFERNLRRKQINDAKPEQRRPPPPGRRQTYIRYNRYLQNKDGASSTTNLVKRT